MKLTEREVTVAESVLSIVALAIGAITGTIAAIPLVVVMIAWSETGSLLAAIPYSSVGRDLPAFWDSFATFTPLSIPFNIVAIIIGGLAALLPGPRRGLALLALALNGLALTATILLFIASFDVG
jgi:hypothetical protein